MMSQVHDLKTWPRHFQAIWDGRKSFEMRRNDRGYKVGDTLILREWEPSLMYGVDGGGEYKGRYVTAIVTYLLDQDEEQPEFIADNWVIMAIRVSHRSGELGFIR